jgi:hypothetical protein
MSEAMSGPDLLNKLTASPYYTATTGMSQSAARSFRCSEDHPVADQATPRTEEVDATPKADTSKTAAAKVPSKPIPIVSNHQAQSGSAPKPKMSAAPPV